MVKIYVIDTNVLIQAPYAIHCFDDNFVVLPLVVIEELDKLKKVTVKRVSMHEKRFVFWNSFDRKEIY